LLQRLGKTIVIDGTNITWSQAGRTQKRHQIRASKRSKLSKRLLKLVLNEYQIKTNQAQSEYLNGLKLKFFAILLLYQYHLK
jgi:predicted ArsR family transcriptional regulator